MSKELKETIAVARRVHDRITPADGQVVINGAIIRALELIAGQSEHSATKHCEFDEALVERLAIVAKRAWSSDRSVGNMWKDVTLAILSELAMKLDKDQDRIVELDDANERVTDLEKQLADLATERLAAIEDRKRAEAKVRAWETRTRETRPRIVEARLEATGKTPGQVYWDATHQARDANGDPLTLDQLEDIGASAVLRAFGGDALRRVRATAEAINTRVRGADNVWRVRTAREAVKDLVTIISSELAKLEAPNG